MRRAIIGISAYYHDSAAALIVDGEIIAASQEERFTRKKQDSSFPSKSIQYVLEEGGISPEEIEVIIFYDKPLIKFERLIKTYQAFAPRGLISFLSAIPIWIKEKLFLKRVIEQELKKIGIHKVRLLFSEHHLSHAASAFYPSPFEESAILTIDGVGEWATMTIGYGNGNKISVLKELHFPHSIGLLYSAFTYYLGFKVNNGEYKLMGLAPYGNANSILTIKYKEIILTKLMDLREDGSLLLNMRYFEFATGLKMVNEKLWLKLFGIPRRTPDSEITQEYMNLALAIQQVTEKIVVRLVRTTRKLVNSENLVMAGGVALNSVINGKLLSSDLFKNIWVQPAAGDAGGALGAALAGWYIWKNEKRNLGPQSDSMKGAYLGPSFLDKQILSVLRKEYANYKYFETFADLIKITADRIANGFVVGWFQGRMEFGPRALGNRSILADARNPDMQRKLNLQIKYREGFRPFAPSILEDEVDKYLEIDCPSPYMLNVVSVKQDRLKPSHYGVDEMGIYERLHHIRSDIPAVTHVDNSARVQTVNRHTNPKFWSLIREFKKQTGYGVIINTSFNVRGEPIVCTPRDAYSCFLKTKMDYLVIGNFLVIKDKAEA